MQTVSLVGSISNAALGGASGVSVDAAEVVPGAVVSGHQGSFPRVRRVRPGFADQIVAASGWKRVIRLGDIASSLGLIPHRVV
jgi:hypothetical protein